MPCSPKRTSSHSGPRPLRGVVDAPERLESEVVDPARGDGVVRPPRKDVDNISSIERAIILKECDSWMTELGYANE